MKLRREDLPHPVEEGKTGPYATIIAILTSIRDRVNLTLVTSRRRQMAVESRLAGRSGTLSIAKLPEANLVEGVCVRDWCI